MKMKKLLLFVVLASTFSASAYDFETDGICYQTISEQDLTCKVTYREGDYNSYSGDIVIPSVVAYDGRTFSVISIGDYAFDHCENLNSLTIPASVTTIGKWAFYDCVSLTSLTIPTSVTSIGNGAFSKCESLTSMDIPSSVTEIGHGLLVECSSLESISGKYASADHRCLIINGVLDSFAPAGLTEYTLPESINSIGEWSFSFCHDLTSITIPSSVASIGERAFKGCSGLVSFKVENDDPSSIELKEPIFDAETPLTCVLYVPQGSKDLYASAPYWQDFRNIEEYGTSGIDDIHADDTFNKLNYYDLNGRCIVNPIGGIYIHDGKKIYIPN